MRPKSTATRMKDKFFGRGTYLEYETRDGTYDAYFRRLAAHEKLLVSRGKLSREDAEQTLTSPIPATKEAAAKWLREELARSRQGERTSGKAPVRRGLALPRIEIADLAMTMAEACGGSEQLLCLLQELLRVDRHRWGINKRHPRARERAAQIEGRCLARGRNIGLRELARAVHVVPSTIHNWRADSDYRRQVEHFKIMALQPPHPARRLVDLFLSTSKS